MSNEMGTFHIKDFMTPKNEIIWLNVDDSIFEIKKKISNSNKTTFLVYRNNINNVLGAVETNDILIYFIDNSWDNLGLEEIVQPVIVLQSNLPALIAIEKLRNLSINIALIKNKDFEFDEVSGLISFHDILEAIVGGFKIDQ